jgi:hypothetical protein
MKNFGTDWGGFRKKNPGRLAKKVLNHILSISNILIICMTANETVPHYLLPATIYFL